MVTIRAACADDAAAIAAVRAQSWQAAYEGVIPADVLATATGPESVAAQYQRIRRGRWTGMIVAEIASAAVGFASFGPERQPDGQPGSAPGPGPVPGPAHEPGPGPAHEPVRAELYAIYVLREHWSTGAGRALMDAVLERAGAAGYPRISLWVLKDNPRARRFYERAGFRESGDSQVLETLGGVMEVRYERSLWQTAELATSATPWVRRSGSSAPWSP